MSQALPTTRISPAASPHVIRFLVALSLLVGITLIGISLDNRQLDLKRRTSLQTFRASQLQRRAETLRLEVELLQTPERLKSALQAASHPSRSRADINLVAPRAGRAPAAINTSISSD